MKLTKRSCVTVAVLGTMAATAAIAVPSGSAQGPGATTLSFYEPNAQSIFKLQDIPPKSPGKSPESPKFRFSIGDKVTISSPLYDKKGGTRQGRLYVDATFVKGGGFDKAASIATGTYVLNDGSQISIQGYFTFATDSRAAVVGGTGRFEGASGNVVSMSSEDSSTDTLTVVP